MSRSVVIPALSMSVVMVAGVIDALKKMRLSKAEGLFPMVGDRNMLDGMQNNSEVPLDYPMALPSLPLLADIDIIPKLASDPFGLEGIMPLELPMAASKEIEQRPVPSMPEFQLLTQAQSGEAKAAENEKRLENLLGILEESGMKVKDVKELPSGTTRITLDDFLKGKETPEPVLVRVRR